MLPKVILFNSISVDGCINNFKIAPEIIKEISSELKFDAVLMDKNTLKIHYGIGSSEEYGRSFNEITIPLMVVPDVHGEIRTWNEILNKYQINDLLVICSRSTPQEYLNFLEENSVNYMIIGYDDVNLPTALEELNIQFGVKTILVAGDGLLNGKLIDYDLVEEINVLINPDLVFCIDPNSIYTSPELSRELEGRDLRLIEMKKLRNEIIILKYRLMKYEF